MPARLPRSRGFGRRAGRCARHHRCQSGLRRGQRFRRSHRKATFSAHMGLHADETARPASGIYPCRMRWKAGRIFARRTAPRRIVQPLITPLYDTRTPHALLPLLPGRAIGRPRPRPRRPGGHAAAISRPGGGVRSRDGCRCRHRGAAVDFTRPPAGAEPHAGEAPALVVAPDPTVWDGRFANNAWLQECPKPFTKEVWGNAIELSRGGGQALGLATADGVRISSGASHRSKGRCAFGSGQADGTIAVPLGYGRTGPGRSATAWASTLSARGAFRRAWSIARLGERMRRCTRPSATPRLTRRMRSSFRRFPLVELAGRRRRTEHRATCRRFCRRSATGRRLHLGDGDRQRACIGCNACVVACQAENNIPVVGPEEIDRHRDMHWLRIDSYERGEETDCRRLRAGAVHALREGALRAGLSGRGFRPRRRRPQRPGLQPLHRHALLPGQLPLQGAAVQLVRLCRRPGLRGPRRRHRSRRSATPTSRCAHGA